jgi:hypothetical protein
MRFDTFGAKTEKNLTAENAEDLRGVAETLFAIGT